MPHPRILLLKASIFLGLLSVGCATSSTHETGAEPTQVVITRSSRLESVTPSPIPRIIRLEMFASPNPTTQEQPSQETVLLDPNVKISDLHSWLAARGRSLGFAFPLEDSLTVQQGIDSNARGSSEKHPFKFRDLVIEDTEAATVNPGTPIRLAVFPLFSLNFQYRQFNETAFKSFLKHRSICDFELGQHFQKTKRIVYICGQFSKQPGQGKPLFSFLKSLNFSHSGPTLIYFPQK